MKKIYFSLVFLIVYPVTVFGSDFPDFPFLQVTGVAETEVAPDKVELSFSLVEFGKDPEKAMITVSNRGEKILELSNKYNISKDRIISYGIDKSVTRARNSNYQKLEILGYEVSQSFKITILDISKYPEFVNSLVGMPNVSNIQASFDVKDKDEILRSLVKKAGDDAKRKADDLAAGLGVSIKSVYAINQDTSFATFFANFGVSEVSRYLADVASPVGQSFNMFVPKSIPITKSVNVIYKIKP